MGELAILPLFSASHFPSVSQVRLFDTRVLWYPILEKPPPCTLFYLADNCKHGPECRYAHDYMLDAEHYEEMKINAKKSPCPSTNRSSYLWILQQQVSNRSRLIISRWDLHLGGILLLWAHVGKCVYLKLGKCKFVGGTPQSMLLEHSVDATKPIYTRRQKSLETDSQVYTPGLW